MRRLLSFVIVLCLLVSPLYALADYEEDTATFEQVSTEKTIGEAQAAILVEASSLQVISSFNADTPRSVAGLAKLPAMLVIAEAVDKGLLSLTRQITVSTRAAGVGGPSAFLEAGEIIEASHLMKAAAMICAGDAIIALGETAFGTESAFVEEIKSRLIELGIENCVYEDGLGKGAMLSSRSLAVLGGALMQSDCFSKHAKLTYEVFTHADGRETELANANRMLRDYGGCAGVATGSSSADGYCGVFFVARGDTQLISVVIGAKNTSDRFNAARNMFEEGFANKRTQKLAGEGEVLAEGIRVRGGKNSSVNLVAKETIVLLLERNDPTLVPVKDIPEHVAAPLTTSDVVGNISYQTPEGIEMGRVELVPQTAVEELLFRDCIRSVFLTFLRL